MNDFLQSLRGGQKDKRVSKTRRGFDNASHYNSPPHYHSQGGYQNTRAGNIKRGPRTHQPSGPSDDLSVFTPELVDNISSLVETIAKNQKLLISIQERRASAEERKAAALENIAGYLSVSAVPVMPETDQKPNDNKLSDTSSPADSFPHDMPEPKKAENKTTETRKKPTPIKKPADLEIPVEISASPEKQPAVRAAKRKKVAPKTEKKQIKVLKRTKAQKLEAKKTASQNEDSNKGLLSREAVMNIIYTMREKGATFDEVAKHFVELGQPTFSGRGEWHAQTVHRLCNKRK